MGRIDSTLDKVGCLWYTTVNWTRAHISVGPQNLNKRNLIYR